MPEHRPSPKPAASASPDVNERATQNNTKEHKTQNNTKQHKHSAFYFRLVLLSGLKLTKTALEFYNHLRLFPELQRPWKNKLSTDVKPRFH